MRLSQTKKIWFYGLAFGLTACDFSGDELREFLPLEVANAPSIYNERDILFCAVSIYQVPDENSFEQLPLAKSERSRSDWLRLPLNGNADYGSFAAQALYAGDDCFDSEAKRITGMDQLSNYYSSERNGFFVELGHNLILVHDTDFDLIIISSRSR